MNCATCGHPVSSHEFYTNTLHGCRQCGCTYYRPGVRGLGTTQNAAGAREMACSGGKIGAKEGPGDCVNSPGVWPNLMWRFDVLNSMPPGGDT